MGEYGTIIAAPSPGGAQLGETVRCNALVRNRTGESQYFWLRLHYTGPGYMREKDSPGQTYLPYQQTYMDVAFSMPDYDVEYYIDLWRSGPPGLTVSLEARVGPINVPFIVWTPSLPEPPKGPFVLPDEVRNNLLKTPWVGPFLVDLAEWFLGSLNANWGWLYDLFTAYAEARAKAEAVDSAFRQWLQEKDPWFGQEYSRWVVGTLELAKLQAQGADEDQNQAWYAELDPLRKGLGQVAQQIGPIVDPIAAFLDDTWGWLKDHTPLGVIEYMATAAYNVLIRLPDNWSNFFWAPIDWFLEVLDLWLYETVEE